MKLTKEHIGKKVRWTSWEADHYFIPEQFTHDGILVYGYDNMCEQNRDWAVSSSLSVETGSGWELIDEPEQGLSLLEAMQSGKPFRPLGGCWPGESAQTSWATLQFDEETEEDIVQFEGASTYCGLSLSILTARYELKPEPKKVEVTAEMLEGAYQGWLNNNWTGLSAINYIKKELGLD